jgi:hypothetical protein
MLLGEPDPAENAGPGGDEAVAPTPARATAVTFCYIGMALESI